MVRTTLMTRIGRRIKTLLLSCLAALSVLAPAALYAQAPSVTLTQISSDPFTAGPGQHATQVEPHMLANGSTLVAAFQTGRIAPGGSTDKIGRASCRERV